MVLILVCVAMVAAAVAFVIWMIHMCLTTACPVCRENEGADEMAIPIIPGVRWWCPACNSTIKQGELLERRSR